MKAEYKDFIILSIIIAIAGIGLGIFLDYKPGIPFYFTGTITILVEIISLIIFVMKKLNELDK